MAVHPADVHGRFARARSIVFVVLIAVYAALPWVKIGGHPAVFLDLERRAFYLFGATFNAQDFWMSVFVVTGLFFALVYMTAVAGRVWCGWACPQTVFLEGVYRKVERWIEGPREKRIRRNEGPWTFDKVARKTLKMAIFVVLSFVIAHVFLAYFVSIPKLFDAMRHAPAQHPEAFLIVMSLSAALFFNFAWFREQFCVVLCPYGRLQSVLLDVDSLVVGYDRARGEPRGKAVKHAGEESVRRGDCVDCRRCVVVCPTGIDIRNGLQMDCLACTACIDACDEIMDKLHRPRGLIRYDSQRGLGGEKTRLWRPRIALYTALGALGIAAATFAFSGRGSFEANVLRVLGPPYTVEGGDIRNAFTIHLVNKRGEDTTFAIEPEPTGGARFVVPLREVKLAPFAQVTAPVIVTVPAGEYRGEFPIRVRVAPIDGAHREVRTVSAPFLGPR